MATIRRRGDLQWQVLIRKRGFSQQSKTFDTKAEAEAWAAAIESEMVRGVFVSRSAAEQTTLRDILQRYEREVSPLHKGVLTVRYRLRQLCREEISSCFLASLQPLHVSRYRDARMKFVGPATIERELTQLQAVIEHARKEWSISLPDNPVRSVKRPRYNNERNRRLTAAEEELLLTATTQSERRADGTFDHATHTPWLKPIVIIAIETAMCQSEIAALTWENVDLDIGTTHLPDKKTDDRGWLH